MTQTTAIKENITIKSRAKSSYIHLLICIGISALAIILERIYDLNEVIFIILIFFFTPAYWSFGALTRYQIEGNIFIVKKPFEKQKIEINTIKDISEYKFSFMERFLGAMPASGFLITYTKNYKVIIYPRDSSLVDILKSMQNQSVT